MTEHAVDGNFEMSCDSTMAVPGSLPNHPFHKHGYFSLEPYKNEQGRVPPYITGALDEINVMYDNTFVLQFRSHVRCSRW